VKESLEHIIQGCLDNQRTSQKKLFELYNKELLAKAYRLTSNVENSKEATQECWIEAFKNISNYNHKKGAFRSWVYTILIRQCWKVIKRQPDTVQDDIAAKLQGQESLIIDQLACEELLNEMSHIPKISRMVFKLFVIEGYRHKEIGDTLDISESTSRAHLKKARKIMRERYNIINKITHDEL